MKVIEGDFISAPPYPGTDGGVQSLTLDVYLTTLLYGGGPEAGHPDNVTPFRAASIRGHLRWWWRAIRGGQFANWEDLRKREGEVWGDTDAPSPVRIRVECPPERRPKLVALQEIPSADPRRYALFPPYNEKKPDPTARRLQQGGGFRLVVSLSEKHTDLRADVESALWAWLNFGGLGARTRRGAGALYCPQYAGWDPDRFVGDGQTKPWPTMKGGTLLCGTRPMSWPDCWRDLLMFYRAFRQDRPIPRGKTRWPEPDEIRAIRQQEQEPGPAGFPRSALGLPIIFHFKDAHDPADQTLSPERQDRMSSPVILRPLAINQTQALPTILILNTAPPQALWLSEGKDSDDRKIRVSSGRRDAIAELIARASKQFNASPVRI